MPCQVTVVGRHVCVSMRYIDPCFLILLWCLDESGGAGVGGRGGGDGRARALQVGLALHATITCVSFSMEFILYMYLITITFSSVNLGWRRDFITHQSFPCVRPCPPFLPIPSTPSVFLNRSLLPQPQVLGPQVRRGPEPVVSPCAAALLGRAPLAGCPGPGLPPREPLRHVARQPARGQGGTIR